MRHSRRKIALLRIVMGVVGFGLLGGAVSARQETGSNAPLPTGRNISPQGQQTEVGSFPANIVTSPDGKYLVVSNTGFREYLSVLSATDGHLVSQLSFNSEPGGKKGDSPALYWGLAFGPGADSSSATLYASRGPEDRISLYTLSANGTLSDTGRSLNNPSSLPEEAKDARPNFAAGIALNSTGTRLYVANNMTSRYTRFKGSISILDVAGNKVLATVPTPGFPFAVAALTKGAGADRKVYVSSERDGTVAVVDVSQPAVAHSLYSIPTGDHPMALLLDSAQKRLFVANAGSDTVSVIDTDTDKVVNTILLRPEEARGLPGATPTGLALNTEENRLYVSLADMSAVAVVDLSDKDTLTGYIPAGWYPSAVAVSVDGVRLFVANAKGVKPQNPNGQKVGPDGKWGQYIQNIIEGTVSTVPTPNADTLKQMTAQVIANNHLTPNLADANRNSPLPKAIKHVIYIIKENRTYDQVLGDLTQGNGDPSLVLFGRNVTPNQHALAERFVLLDNFYVCAEVSADGWDWSTSGMISEYTARNAPFNYSGRGRSYDFEGENNGTAIDLMGLPDVARAPSGYIWDNCLKHGVSIRNYGFYVSLGPGNRPDSSLLPPSNHTTKKALVKHTDADFLEFAMDYADSDAWKMYGNPSPKLRKTFGKHDAPSRVAEWKQEFAGYVKDNNLPSFLMVRLPRDHTAGTAPNQNTPRAMVADNDYGVGELVEAVSHSKYWNETAIFVLEDDAQAGYDHVDAHRSPCYVISPYIARSTVDHHFYNTDSVLRTMEALLGLPPTSQYEATAPLLTVFGNSPTNTDPFAAILPAQDIIGEINTQTAYRARESARLDFRTADRVPDDLLNDILWHSIKGANTPAPPVRHSLSLATRRSHDDD